MTRKIVIASQKGGVGKTTVAINLGYSLRRLGSKVLIVDADPQGGIATVCKKKELNSRGLVQVLRGEVSFADAVLPLQDEQLSVIGTGMATPEDVVYFEEEAMGGRLANLFESGLDSYDFVLFDAPVGIGFITRELLAASDSLLQVINCRAGTAKTVARLLNLYVWMRKNFNQSLKLEGILFNMVDESNQIEQKIMKQLMSRLPVNLFFSTIIPHDSIFEIAALKGVPLEQLKAGHGIAKKFMEMAVEVDRRKHQSVGELIYGEEEEISLPEDGHEEKNASGEFVDRIKEVLADLCGNGGFYGAVVADEMGFPLADYQSPLEVDALATYSSLLGEALSKAGSIIEMPEANNLVMDINENDKMLLHRFAILDDQYSLVAVCSQENEAIGEITLAANRIAGVLS